MAKPPIEDLIKDPVVGPLLQRYLRGKIEAYHAHHDLLNGTINHVMALGVIDDMEAKNLEAIRAMFGEPAALPAPSDPNEAEVTGAGTA